MGKYSWSEQQDKRREERRPAPKPRQPIKRKVSPVDLAKVKALAKTDENKAIIEASAEMQRWFEERRKSMTGKCVNCGGKSCKDSDQYYKFSIAHLLPKAHFKSVRTNPDNWLELCHFGNSCHANMDNKVLDLIEMSCWDEIVVKFQKLYPHITKEERRRIPNVLLEYIGTDS